MSTIETKKNRILKAALKLFEKRGFHQVSVRNIISKAGVSNGCFYHHFNSKDELLYFINDFVMDYVLRCAKKILSANKSPTEKLHGIITTFVKTFYLYNLEVVVMYQESHYLTPEYYEKMRLKRDEYNNIVLSILKEGVEKEEFRPIEPLTVVAFSIFGMVNWTYTWYDPQGALSIEEISNRYVDFIFNGILTEKAKRKPSYQQYFLNLSS